ncbi:MAG TPA: hypothetical protein VLC06_27415 [Polyangia bacterium]|nr:hypothetical protein [Polyangia bacterium]
MTRALVVVVLLLGSCSSGGKTGSVDGGTGGGAGAVVSTGGQGGSGAGGVGGNAGGAPGSGGAGGGGAPGSGGAGGANDQALCTAVCATFVSCGVTTSASCETECAAGSASYKSCVGAAGTDCNALAMCYFQATASTDCPGGGGVPSGSATCATTDDCEGTCNTNGSGAACKCACATAASPTVAGLLLAINSCASDKCAAECAGASSSECNTCFQNDCTASRQNCLAQ